MVLAGGHGQHILAVDHHNKAGFFALQKFFNHHAATGVAKGIARQHVAHGFFCLLQRLGHNHAFTSRQTVGFHYDGRALFAEVGQSGFQLREIGIGRRGNCVAGEKILGESLGAFQLRGAFAGAEAG